MTKKSTRGQKGVRTTNNNGVATMEYVIFFSAVVAVAIAALDPNSGSFTGGLRRALTTTANSMTGQASGIAPGGREPSPPGPQTLFASSNFNDFRKFAGPGTTGTINIDGEDVIFADGNVYLRSNLGRIDIDPTKNYVLSGSFMSAGDSSGRLYLGLIPYDKDGRQIIAAETKRYGTPGTVQSVSATEIVFQENLSGWYQSGSIAGNRQLGIYLDGDTTKLPDYVVRNYSDYYSTDPTEGTYSVTSGNVASLLNPIPATISSQIVPGMTVIQNHSSGGTYIYAGASNQTVPLDTWTTYTSPVITGEAFNTNTKFWPETASVEVVLLNNYYSPRFDPVPVDQQLLYIKDIKFEAVP